MIKGHEVVVGLSPSRWILRDGTPCERPQVERRGEKREKKRSPGEKGGKKEEAALYYARDVTNDNIIARYQHGEFLTTRPCGNSRDPRVSA